MILLSGLSLRLRLTRMAILPLSSAGCAQARSCTEELLIGDDVTATEHPMIMRANEDHLPWPEFKLAIEALLAAVAQDDYVRAQLLRETVSGYAPEGEIVDWIHTRQGKI